MRIGIMIGPETRNYAGKVDRLCEEARAADAAGFATAWIPQLPQDFDAMTAAALMGRETTRIELGTAVVPLQSRHPVALGQQALSVQAVCGGRFTLGVGPSHHWVIDAMLGLPYEQPAQVVADYLDAFDAMFAGPGPVDVENDRFRIHNPLDITDVAPTPVLLAALGPVMLRLAGERTDGTVLWMADERAIAEHVVPRITTAAERAGRPSPRVVAGVPVGLCRTEDVDAARERANRILGHAEYSPNYQRLLERGDATDVGDIAALGSESDIVRRLRSFADAGTTDLSVRILPVGQGRDELVASSQRTREFLGSLAPELRS
jgi:F420-dependent oxidoreductase-like protein